jgi:hypothetical protein
MDVGQWFARAFFVLLFGLSIESKVRRPRSFLDGVADYRIVPRRLVRFLAVAIVAAESTLVLGLALVGGPEPWIGAAFILAIFAVAQAWSWARGGRHGCHCFGADETIGPASIGRSLGLSFAALATLVLAPRLDPLAAMTGSLLELVGIGIAAGLLATFVSSPHDVARSLRQVIRTRSQGSR